MVNDQSLFISDLEKLIQFQIESYSHDIENKSVEIKAVHESGQPTCVIRFYSVVHFSIEAPSFNITSPYIIDNVGFDFLRDKESRIYDSSKFHHIKNDIPCIEISKNTVALELVGDIYIKIVFTGLSIG